MTANSLTALSGMNAAMRSINVAAHNIANLQTSGFRRQHVLQQAEAEGGVRAHVKQAEQTGAVLETDVVNQYAASCSFIANLRVLQTHRVVMGALLDVKA